MRKRILAFLLCVFILGSSFVQVSAANSTTDTAMNSTQLAAKRFSAKIKNQTEQETAREIMRQLGMSEKNVQAINEIYLDMIYNATRIQGSNIYGKIDENGIETQMNSAECEAAANQLNVRRKNASNMQASPLSLETESPTELTDSYFHKVLCIVETKNAPKGTLGVLCGFTWLSSPFYRCLDAITLSSLDIDFKSGTENMVFSATEQTESLTNPNIKKTAYVTEGFDFAQLDQKGMLTTGGHYHAFKYNLPNDLLTTTINTCYEDMNFLIAVSAAPVHVESATDFTVTASYFHQYIGVEIDMSFNMSGDVLNIAFPLNLSYWSPKQIAVSCKYRP